MYIDIVQSTTGASLQQAKQIKAGDVVHGKVISSSDGKTTISMQDGSSFTATLADGVDLKAGQQVKLVVTSMQDGKITMQIAPQGEGTAKLAESTLAGMNIPTGGKNVGLAAAFLLQGISLSPELMQKAADILAKYPGLDMDAAAFMAANDMDAGFAPAIQDLASGHNSISSQLAALEQILIDNGYDIRQPIPLGKENPAQPISADSAESGQPTQVADGDRPVLTQPANDNPAQPGQTQADVQAMPSKQAVAPHPEPQGNTPQNEGVGNPAQNNINALTDTFAPTDTAMQPDMGEVQAPSANATVQDNAAAQSAGEIAAQAIDTGRQTNAQTTAPAGFQPGPETAKALAMFIGRDNPGAVAVLQGEGIAAAAEAMTRAAALPEEQGKAVVQSFVDSSGLSQPDAEKLSAQLLYGAETLRESITPQQNGIGPLLDKLGQMFARLDSNAAKSVELRLANRLPEKLEDIQQTISKSSASGREAMTATVQRSLGQSKAMEQINQFVYAQIPVDLNGKKDMAELYVFKRPGAKKRIDAAQVTMVIALDTANIGHVESLIKVDMKNVFLRFRVEDDDIAGALRAGYTEAEQALASIGYNLLELRCELGEEDINILNAASTVQAEFLDVRNLDFFI